MPPLFPSLTIYGKRDSRRPYRMRTLSAGSAVVDAALPPTTAPTAVVGPQCLATSLVRDSQRTGSEGAR
ncbi:MAG: hypothetical protein DLM58_19305 [Pseudonocardiales bacterium]|nr:MAG: hypothetical protein DLM58_19305 [Pseudonocardiales bacterium]